MSGSVSAADLDEDAVVIYISHDTCSSDDKGLPNRPPTSTLVRIRSFLQHYVQHSARAGLGAGLRMDQVYVWLDYACLEWDAMGILHAQRVAMPLYLMCADEVAYLNSPTVLNQAWNRTELFLRWAMLRPHSRPVTSAGSGLNPSNLGTKSVIRIGASGRFERFVFGAERDDAMAIIADPMKGQLSAGLKTDRAAILILRSSCTHNGKVRDRRGRGIERYVMLVLHHPRQAHQATNATKTTGSPRQTQRTHASPV
mmetsp:Transcript_107398/g.312237  ORF Transcript_107398/g.312237 Transcript_107398/m.312237 type:complete len:255 (-) Transcript_107398:2293-3057(-)